MLLTLTTTHLPATDLGFLLQKHPARARSSELGFGHARVFFPEASKTHCTAALLLDIDPIKLKRRGSADFSLEQYANDRPYVASSFMSVAIARVFGSALRGRCDERPELAEKAIPLQADIHVLPARRGPDAIADLFEPLGYDVNIISHTLDMQLQINVIDQAVLEDAIAHPERHQNLIVRIGGYSEYFNRLSPELKQTLLERTEHAA